MTRYGAVDLRDSMQLYWMSGLGIAIAIHLAAIASYRLAAGDDYSAGRGEVYVPVHVGTWLPEPIGPITRVQNLPQAAAVKNRVGTPVPVPEATVDPEQTMTPNVDLNPVTGPPPGVGTGTAGQDPPVDIPDPSTIPYQPVDGLPKVLQGATPDYPALALKSGLEGTVFVKILVDKDGHPRTASVVKSDMDIFNDAAIAAAGKFLFAPGYTKAGPVAVWVVIPFKFRLADRK